MSRLSVVRLFLSRANRINLGHITSALGPLPLKIIRKFNNVIGTAGTVTVGAPKVFDMLQPFFRVNANSRYN
jgi:hypothetical protein